MVLKNPRSSDEFISLYQIYGDVVKQLHRNIQTILNFYGVNTHGDNHNQNRTAMHDEAREFMLEWIGEYLHDHFYNAFIDDTIEDLALNITELFIVQAAHLTEGQLYTVYVDIILPTAIVVDRAWQGFAMLNAGSNVTEVHEDEQLLPEPVTDFLPGTMVACYT